MLEEKYRKEKEPPPRLNFDIDSLASDLPIRGERTEHRLEGKRVIFDDTKQRN